MGTHAQLKQILDGSEAMDQLYAAILGPNADGVDQRTHILRGSLRLQLHLAERCFDIMNEQLRFNIVKSPSSFLRNQDIPNLKEHVETNISPLLSYACQFWPLHASVAVRGGAAVPSLAHFLEKQVLEWLEVMSLIQSSPEEALAPLAQVTVCCLPTLRTISI